MNKHQLGKRALFGGTTFMLILLNGIAFAALGARVELTMVAEKELVSINEAGEVEVNHIAPNIVIPGDVIVYSVNYQNVGDDIADSTYITNAIPEHMTYMEESASGEGTDIAFSVDGGRRFGKPTQLTVLNKEGEAVPATMGDYTHIRWVFTGSLAPGDSGQVLYRARIN